MRKLNPPAPRFLARPRELYGTALHVDESDTIERIREATAMCDEPESIGPAIVSYVETAHKYDTLRRAREIEDAREARSRMTMQQRLRNVRARAKQQRINVSGDLHVVERMLDRARVGGRHDPPAAVRRLEAIEAKLDGATNITRDLRHR